MMPMEFTRLPERNAYTQTLYNMKKPTFLYCILPAVLSGSIPLKGTAQSTYTSNSATGAWNTVRWNNLSDGPVYAESYTTGNPVYFTSGSYSFAGMGSATNVGNLYLAPGVTVSFTSGSSTFGTGGNIRTIDTDSGATFIFGLQSVSAAAGTGFHKTGTGTLSINSGGNYQGGVTLSGGTLIIGGVNALGNGPNNTLTLQQGTLTANATAKDLTGRIGGGIFIAGDIQFGETPTINSYAGNGNIILGNDIFLGNAHREMTLGNSAAITLSGIISNQGNSGITFSANIHGTGSFRITNPANNFTGPLYITGNGSSGRCKTSFTSDSCLGHISNPVIINGGVLSTADGTGFTLNSGRSIYIGNTPGTAIMTEQAATLTLSGPITDYAAAAPGSFKKEGTGTLSLEAVCSYTGYTHVANGSITITDNNRLPVSTIIYLGDSSNTAGTFDLNGYHQEIAGLYSIAGASSLQSNEITSATTALLTINGKGWYGKDANGNSSVITGAVALEKTGNGTFTLADENTYSGSTTITTDTLQLSHSGGTIASGSVSLVDSGGTLRISADQTLDDLTILPGGTLLIDSGVLLTINGDLIIPSNARLIINGQLTSAGSYRSLSIQAEADVWIGNNAGFSVATGSWSNKNIAPSVRYTFTAASGTPFGHDFTVVDASGLTVLVNTALDRPVNLYGRLSIQNNATLTTGGQLRLKSTSATESAMVGPVTGFITGDVIHERYLSSPNNGSGGRSWRLLTTPVKGSNNNSVYENWQNNGLVDGTGLEIWGPTGTGSFGNGLAPGISYSLRTYDHIMDAFSGVGDTKQEPLFTTTANRPFLCFVSGPYGSGNIVSGAAATKNNAVGALITGHYSISFTPPDSARIFQLIANPYACPVDFDKTWNNSGTVNINRKFWVIDPSLGNIGAYTTVMYDQTSNSYITSAGNQTRYIQNGQAFFVEGNQPAQASTIFFQENDKEITQQQGAMFRTNGGASETFRLELYKQNNNGNQLADGTIAVCHMDHNNAIDEQDAIKFPNFNEGIAIQKAHRQLSIESRTLYDHGDTLHLLLTGMQQANYNLVMQPGNMNIPNLLAYLHDAYLNTAVPVSLAGTNTYTFNVNSDSNSASSGRFCITFTATSPLSIDFTSFTAISKAYHNELSWTIFADKTAERFEVEKSTDGNTFSCIATITANHKTSYHYQDYGTGSEIVYYRIKASERGKLPVYSRVIKLNNRTTGENIQVFPNPADANHIRIQLSELAQQAYALTLYNIAGQVIRTETFTHKAGGNKIMEWDTGSMPNGMYIIKLTNMHGIIKAEFKIVRQ